MGYFMLLEGGALFVFAFLMVRRMTDNSWQIRIGAGVSAFVAGIPFTAIGRGDILILEIILAIGLTIFAVTECVAAKRLYSREQEPKGSSVD